ncbi:MAG: hypothetical protein M1834_002904 [Cirrosporium novae-zelandiae]|nr:MAG: hypothetical protein M1834_002904 [Cirrosporium novae-zelandiae]
MLHGALLQPIFTRSIKMMRSVGCSPPRSTAIRDFACPPQYHPSLSDRSTNRKAISSSTLSSTYGLFEEPRTPADHACNAPSSDYYLDSGVSDTSESIQEPNWYTGYHEGDSDEDEDEDDDNKLPPDDFPSLTVEFLRRMKELVMEFCEMGGRWSGIRCTT